MLYPIIICTLAGFSTALGALPVVLKGEISEKTMAFSQAFAAGVMLTVSIADLLLQSYGEYFVYMSSAQALKSVASLFICGWVMGVALSILPEDKNKDFTDRSTAKRMALITTLLIVFHNLPEGMLTMFSSIENYSSGLVMAFAVALHNFPEGMAIAAPVLYATKSKKRAFLQALFAGMREPLGALIVYILFADFITPAFLNGLMPVIAGVMCYGALCELIPSAISLSNFLHTFCGIITGIITMSIGILAF